MKVIEYSGSGAFPANFATVEYFRLPHEANHRGIESTSIQYQQQTPKEWSHFDYCHLLSQMNKNGKMQTGTDDARLSAARDETPSKEKAS